MFWNITIAVILAILAAATSVLAGHLAATKRWHKWLFWGAGVLMVILIGIQTYRNENAQADLQKQLNTIQKNTETPPTFNVTVPPAAPAPIQPHRSGGFLQFEKVEFREQVMSQDKPFSVNIYVRNSGTEPIYGTCHFFAVQLADGAAKTESASALLDKKMHQKLLEMARKAQKDSLAQHLKGSVVGIGESIWGTFGFNSLTSEQVAGIADGNLRFYVFVWARWDNGDRDVDDCRWLQATGSTKISEWKPIWHYCGG